MISSKLHNFLSILGFTDQEITLYLTLAQKGTLTTLELSRASGISRTQVYRLLEELKTKGAVEEIVDEHRHLARAVDAGQLEQLVNQKIREGSQLLRLFPEVQQIMQGQIGQNEAETKVLFYRGREGLRQLVWHTLRAQKEVVGFTYRRIEEYIGTEFMLDWRNAFIRKALKFRDIYSEEYQQSQSQTPWPVNYPKINFQSRFIPQSLLSVNIQMDIYNDVTSQYSWHEGEVFGVEIYNRKIAHFQRQIFGLVWAAASKTG